MALTRRKFVLAGSLSAGAALLSTRLLEGDPSVPAFDAGDWRSVRNLFALSPDWVHASLFFARSTG